MTKPRDLKPALNICEITVQFLRVMLRPLADFKLGTMVAVRASTAHPVENGREADELYDLNLVQPLMDNLLWDKITSIHIHKRGNSISHSTIKVSHITIKIIHCNLRLSH